MAASSRLSAATMSSGGRSSVVTSGIWRWSSACDVAMFSEPISGALERIDDRALRQAEFAHRFRGVKPHAVTRHLDAFDGHVRRAAGDVDGPEVFQPRVAFGYPVRHPHFWCRNVPSTW